MSMHWPVVKLASSLASQAMSAATSDGWPARPAERDTLQHVLSVLGRELLEDWGLKVKSGFRLTSGRRKIQPALPK